MPIQVSAVVATLFRVDFRRDPLRAFGQDRQHEGLDDGRVGDGVHEAGVVVGYVGWLVAGSDERNLIAAILLIDNLCEK